MTSLSHGAVLAPLGLRGPALLRRIELASAPLARTQAWLEAGDALAQMGRIDRARLAWMRGVEAATSPNSRAVAASCCWRLGQVAESMRELSDALGWYGRSADIFAREGARPDETIARMAIARVTLYAAGAGLARQAAREAVSAAREADDPALLSQALELLGEVAFELGQREDAIASLRDAVRQAERARDATAIVRASVGLADVLIESDQPLPALGALEVALPLLESHESLETRGRGMGLLGLVNLDVGELSAAAEPLKKAHEWLEAAGAHVRRARLLVATARRIEVRNSPREALPLYEQAWALASREGDVGRHRLAPIAYALSRCLLAHGDPVRADLHIIVALGMVEEAGDLEGLARCTELGVRIAARLRQGRLALERLLALARTQARLGEPLRALRTMRDALEATLGMPRETVDIAPIFEEFLELLKQRGTTLLGPGEALTTAEKLGQADHPWFASEVVVLEAERLLSEGNPTDAARAIAMAAIWATRAERRGDALELWDRAIDLGEAHDLSETEGWRVERTIATEN
jgi:tetratricopeptide (TPR) repeat protein